MPTSFPWRRGAGLLLALVLEFAAVLPLRAEAWRANQAVSLAPADTGLLGARARLVFDSMVWNGQDLRSSYTARITPPIFSGTSLYSESGDMTIPVQAETLRLLQAGRTVFLHGQSHSRNGTRLHPVEVEVHPKGDDHGDLLIQVQIVGGQQLRFTTTYQFQPPRADRAQGT